MKNIIGSLLLVCQLAFSQSRETFDLVSYQLPVGFSKKPTADYVLHEKVNRTTRNWCQIIVYHSINSSGSLTTDFETEWKNLVDKNYTGAVRPGPEKTEEGGWTAQSGASPFQFQGSTSYVYLTTISGHGKVLSIVVTMSNLAFEKEIDQFLESLKLTKPTTPVVSNQQPAAVPNQVAATAAEVSQDYGITKSTINFDDGWVSTIDRDKVLVTKGNVTVYIYFPLAHDDASRRAGRDFYWDNYIAKQFQTQQKQYRDHGEVMSSFQAPYIEGNAIHPQTGKSCFIALYVQSANGNMFPVLAVAPDEATLRKTFPKAEHPTESDLAPMRNYNRFAITMNDVIGKWKGSDGSSANYYNAYTGSYAGMGFTAMSDAFEFMANGDYTSKHQGASGMVGTMSTYSQKYSGKATLTDWQIVMTNRYEGGTTTFNAWFEVVPGGRLLHLQDAQYSGLKYSLMLER